MFTTTALACILENNKTFISVAKTNQAVENRTQRQKKRKKQSNLRQLDTHEDPAHEERNDDGSKTHAQQQDAVQPRHQRFVHLVEDNEPQPTQGEHKTGRKAFHDVLAIHTIRHERHLFQTKSLN